MDGFQKIRRPVSHLEYPAGMQVYLEFGAGGQDYLGNPGVRLDIDSVDIGPADPLISRLPRDIGEQLIDGEPGHPGRGALRHRGLERGEVLLEREQDACRRYHQGGREQQG